MDRWERGGPGRASSSRLVPSAGRQRDGKKGWRRYQSPASSSGWRLRWPSTPAFEKPDFSAALGCSARTDFFTRRTHHRIVTDHLLDFARDRPGITEIGYAT